MTTKRPAGTHNAPPALRRQQKIQPIAPDCGYAVSFSAAC
jgi:hypothetical protein